MCSRSSRTGDTREVFSEYLGFKEPQESVRDRCQEFLITKTYESAGSDTANGESVFSVSRETNHITNGNKNKLAMRKR